MSDERVLSGLIGRIYDAGLGAASWDSMLDHVMQVVGAEVSTLFVEDRTGVPAVLDFSSVRGYPASAADSYASYFADRDVRLPAILRLPAGQIYLDDRTMPFAEIERSEIYNDFYRPIGVAHGIGVVPFNDGRRFGVLSAHRAINAGGFRPGDIALFEQIAPHVTRALQLHRQVARATAVANGLTVALNHFAMAVLLVDANAAVIECNLAAEALLRGPACPLRLVAKRLGAAMSNDSAALARAIAEAARTVPAAPPVFRLAKTDGSGSLGVMVTPARGTEAGGMPGGLALVFVSDPSAAPATVPQVLSGQFGLSPMEAQAAVRLAAGERIEDIADARRVSPETVRVQVKRVLAKTDVRSQGQLIGLIFRSLAAVRRS